MRMHRSRGHGMCDGEHVGGRDGDPCMITSIVCACAGHAAMECVMVNMLEAGTRILVANNGIWGIRSQDMARRSACVALLTNVMCIDSQMRQKS